MKVRKTMIAVAVAALIPLGAAAIAGDNEYGSKDKAGAGASFKKLDTNKDGRISQAEAAVDTTVVFSSADANGDGYIDSTEWSAAMSKDQDHSSSPKSMPAEPAPQATAPQDPQPPSSTPTPDTETPRQ